MTEQELIFKIDELIKILNTKISNKNDKFKLENVLPSHGCSTIPIGKKKSLQFDSLLIDDEEDEYAHNQLLSAYCFDLSFRKLLKWINDKLFLLMLTNIINNVKTDTVLTIRLRIAQNMIDKLTVIDDYTKKKWCTRLIELFYIRRKVCFDYYLTYIEKIPFYLDEAPF